MDKLIPTLTYTHGHKLRYINRACSLLGKHPCYMYILTVMYGKYPTACQRALVLMDTFCRIYHILSSVGATKKYVLIAQAPPIRTENS